MLESVLKSSDVLLIVPPFMLPDSQSLAVHVLQACAREKGYTVQVYYANMHFASLLGDDYEKLCSMNYDLLGERLFHRAAYGQDLPSPVNEEVYHQEAIKTYNPISFYEESEQFPLERLQEIEELTRQWVKEVAKEIGPMNFAFVGSTSNYEQNNASMALLRAIKEQNDKSVTFIGGFNCEETCSRGIASLDKDRQFLDFIFSGESEETFVQFLQASEEERQTMDRIITGRPNQDMDTIPMVEYGEYFEQLDFFLPRYREKHTISLSYETSRGCWWGAKSKCRFCGYNSRMAFRQKSAEKVLSEIGELEKYAIKNIDMADLAMPLDYFQTLMPGLKEKDLIIYYEQRASLSLQDLQELKAASITHIQPGLETLSDPLLKAMGKGNSLKGNLMFLRNATSVGLKIYWNLLWGIPDEEVGEYEKMIQMMPALSHLAPPLAIFHMGIVRFSTYFDHYEQYGIKRKYALPSYSQVYPPGADIENLAYFYLGEYESELYDNPEVIKKLDEEIHHWNDLWKIVLLRPRLHLEKRVDGSFVLIDTRPINRGEQKMEMTEEQAGAILQSGLYEDSAHQNWAIEKKMAFVIGKSFISLITAEPDLLEEYE